MIQVALTTRFYLIRKLKKQNVPADPKHLIEFESGNSHLHVYFLGLVHCVVHSHEGGWDSGVGRSRSMKLKC
jgi:hypothetical protein